MRGLSFFLWPQGTFHQGRFNNSHEVWSRVTWQIGGWTLDHFLHQNKGFFCHILDVFGISMQIPLSDQSLWTFPTAQQAISLPPPSPDQNMHCQVFRAVFKAGHWICILRSDQKHDPQGAFEKRGENKQRTYFFRVKAFPSTWWLVKCLFLMSWRLEDAHQDGWKTSWVFQRFHPWPGLYQGGRWWSRRVFFRKTPEFNKSNYCRRPHRTQDPPPKKTLMVADTGFGNFPEFQGSPKVGEMAYSP